jgi:hypothetical protein
LRIAIASCALLVLLGVVACREDQVSRTTYLTLGAAELVSAVDVDPSTNREVPLYHVLFVPELEPPPGGDYGTTGSGGVARDEIDLRYSYYEAARKLAFDSQPVYIRNRKKLEAGGRSFDLAQGNVFVANVSLDGAVTVTQLPSLGAAHDASANAVLQHIKTSLPANARVQALKMPR